MLTCGECKNRQRLDPDENICLVDGHDFEDTFAIWTGRKGCPLDKSPGMAARAKDWIMSRFTRVN